MVGLKTFFINHWPWLSLILCLLFGFLFIQPAHASTIFYSATSSPNYDFTIDAHPPGCRASSVQFASGGSLGEVHYVGQGYRVGGGGVETTFEGRLWDSSGNLLATSTQTRTAAGENTLTVDFGAFAVSPGTSYLLGYALIGGDYNQYWAPKQAGITVGSGGSTFPYIGGSDYPNSPCDVISTSGWGGSGSHQLYITAYSNPPVDAVSITSPSNGSTVPSLGYFGASYTTVSSTSYTSFNSPYYTIQIWADNNPGFPDPYEGIPVGSGSIATTTAGGAGTEQVPSTQSFIPGFTFYAQAHLFYTDPSQGGWNATPHQVATSSVISFSVSTTTSPGSFFPPSASTTTSTAITTANICDPESNFIIYGFCRLFVPQASDFFAFNALKNLYINKPPFGYFAPTVALLQNLGTASSSVDLPDLTDFAGVFGPIRTGVDELLWIVFVFWLFHKMRNIEL